MFPGLPACAPSDDALDALAALTVADSSDNRRIPAGFTYLGQFIDHDITFDPTSRLDRDNDPQALVNFRTPRFDLDSVYGTGPDDQPYLYEWLDGADRGVKLLPNPPRDEASAFCDLPRNAQGRALIGDARNDENLIVSQLHRLFVAFHNRIVDDLRDRGSRSQGADLFDEARQIVRWHYQWIVVHDFLRRVAGGATARAVLDDDAGGRPPRIERRFFTATDEPYIPVEFSGAAFRFGHSMVRSTYSLRPGGGPVALFPGPPDEGGADRAEHLAGFRPVPPSLAIDWDAFFFRAPDEKLNNSSLRIDSRVSPPLHSLPPDGDDLPSLNLRRGRALGLPAGGAVAEAMEARVLTRQQLRLDRDLEEALADELYEATPLWWYVVREAGSELGEGGQRLGPVGGRIVAEVLVGLLEADPQSYLAECPDWRPGLLPAAAEGDFTMLDLIAFTRSPPGPV